MGLGPFIKTRAPKSLLNRGLSPSPTPRQGVSPTIMGHQIGGQTSSEVCTGGGCGVISALALSTFRHSRFGPRDQPDRNRTVTVLHNVTII